MLRISHANGIYKLKVGNEVLGQARTLEGLLENVSGEDFPREFYFHAAEVLRPLVPQGSDNTQISTGGQSA